MTVIFGIWMFTGGALGLLFRDPVVCRFKEATQCYVALGQQLQLQMIKEDSFGLMLSSDTSSQLILKYKKNQSIAPKPLFPRWGFVNKNKTMILHSAERYDAGTYTLAINDADDNVKEFYNLQVNVEAEVSSVRLSYSCLSSGIRKVYCSADGENLRFHWTTDLKPHIQLEDRNTTFLVDQKNGNFTCRVENHVSSAASSAELHPCVGFTQATTGFRVFVIVWLFEVIILLSLLVGAFYIYTGIYRKQRKSENKEVC